MTDNVTYLRDWKAKKLQSKDTDQSRRPLYVNHSTGKISSKPQDPHDLGTRVARVRESLDRINRLMVELKQLSKEEEK